MQYGLASVWERMLALALDMVFMGGGWLLLWLIQLLLIPSLVEVSVYFTVIPWILFYYLAFEQLKNGQSPGKMIMSIRVIRLDGENTGFLDYMMRWVFRGLDIYFSLGGVGVISIISSGYNQRLGDLLANTVVVNVSKSERMGLHSLLKLNKNDNYKVVYPDVVKMSEETMLIVKETLGKYIRLENSAHNEALNLLGEKMANELKIKAPANKQEFLRTLLKDYVILTR